MIMTPASWTLLMGLVWLVGMAIMWGQRQARVRLQVREHERLVRARAVDLRKRDRRSPQQVYDDVIAWQNPADPVVRVSIPKPPKTTWCEGCDRIVRVSTMQWTPEGTYRCVSCRVPAQTVDEDGDGVADTLAAMADELPEGSAAARIPIVCTPTVDPWLIDSMNAIALDRVTIVKTVKPADPTCLGRGSHGHPDVVCAECCEQPRDWGSSERVRG